MSAPKSPEGRSGLANLFVARPIFGIVINLLILIAGLAALCRGGRARNAGRRSAGSVGAHQL